MNKLVMLSVILILSGVGAYAWTAKDDKQMTNKSEQIKLSSGLRYEILKAGSSEKTAQNGNTAVVHYTGWLALKDDALGRKFDSSLDRGQPFSFVVGAHRVIRGWDEGVAGMKVGEKRRLFIPSDLGYGVYGAGALIPPHADLIFDVELLDVR